MEESPGGFHKETLRCNHCDGAVVAVVWGYETVVRRSVQLVWSESEQEVKGCDSKPKKSKGQTGTNWILLFKLFRFDFVWPWLYLGQASNCCFCLFVYRSLFICYLSLKYYLPRVVTNWVDEWWYDWLTNGRSSFFCFRSSRCVRVSNSVTRMISGVKSQSGGHSVDVQSSFCLLM